MISCEFNHRWPIFISSRYHFIKIQFLNFFLKVQVLKLWGKSVAVMHCLSFISLSLVWSSSMTENMRNITLREPISHHDHEYYVWCQEYSIIIKPSFLVHTHTNYECLRIAKLIPHFVFSHQVLEIFKFVLWI